MIASGWFLLAIIGEVAGLQIINAGRALHYQHYVPAGRLWQTHPLAAFAILIQLLIVAAATIHERQALHAWTRQHFPGWRLIAFLAVFAVSSTVPSRSARAYLGELLLAILIQSVNVATLVLLGASISSSAITTRGDRFRSMLPDGPHFAGMDRFAIACAVWVALLCSILSVFCYERHPHVADEVAYVYHARYIAAGMMSMPRPEVPEAFDIDLMMLDKDKWYSPVPPGWPFILAAGVWAGVPWLVNPLLAAVNILLAYKFLGNLYGTRTARIGVVLLSVSPWNIFMGMNFMNHTATLTAALAAGIAFQTATRTRPIANALAGGAAIGLVALIRPLDGAALAVVLGGWYLMDRRLGFGAIAASAAGALLIGGLNLPYNRAMTGDSTLSPIMAYADKYYGPKTNALGFGPERGLGWPMDPFPGHGPADAAVNALLNTTAINTELFGWCTGSLLLIAVAGFSRALTRNDCLMLGTIAAVVGAYSLYWFSGGPDFGARYWFLALIPCVALSARGLEQIGSATALPAVACLCLLSVFVFLPWRAFDKYKGYLGMTPGILQVTEGRQFRGSLVLIEGQRFPDYESAAIYNPLNLRDAGPIYAWDRNAEVRAKVVAAYKERPVWLVEGPTVSHEGYRVVKLLSAGIPYAGRQSLLQKTSAGSGSYGLHR